MAGEGTERREGSLTQAAGGDPTLFSNLVQSDPEHLSTDLSHSARLDEEVKPRPTETQAIIGDLEVSSSEKKSLFGRARSALTRTGTLEEEQRSTTARDVAILETVESGPAPISVGESNKDDDALEIPAFLRRQNR